jgi:WhiB family transcriptional regulator, redox-sensing transcriptional regulator
MVVEMVVEARLRTQMNAWQEPHEDAGPLALWSWRLRAACRKVDSGIFFSPDGERPPERDAREARAKAICARCPVIGPCAAYAIQHDERYGVWGGLSERERAALRRRRHRAWAAMVAWTNPTNGSHATRPRLP